MLLGAATNDPSAYLAFQRLHREFPCTADSWTGMLAGHAPRPNRQNNGDPSDPWVPMTDQCLLIVRGALAGNPACIQSASTP
jgi:hypothetical protein